VTAHDEADGDGFGQSRALLEQVVSWLGGAEAATVDHGELERRVEIDGRELLRRLLQDHLELRAQDEARLGACVDVDGRRRGEVETGHQRCLTTVFGEVTVTRFAYRGRGIPNLHPADAVLNLPVEHHSHGLRRLAAIEASRGSFDDAVEAVRRATGQGVGKRQAESLAGAAAADFDDFYQARRPPPVVGADVVVLSCDGKGIVMRPGALRAATASAAAKAKPKLASRLSKGEKANRKRMAEVVAVYAVTPVARTAGDILSSSSTATTTPAPAPKAKDKWVMASVATDAASAIGAMFDEADRRDPGHQRAWVVLVDGNNHQINRVQAEARQRKVGVVILCDFVHVLEYLWRAAWSFYSEGDPAAEAWVHEKASAVLAGGATRVPPPSGARPPTTASTSSSGPMRMPAPATSPPRRPTWATPKPSHGAGRSPPASSRAPAGTWSRTGWTSPVHAGASRVPRRSSNCGHCASTATSTTTGRSTSHGNGHASMKLATWTTSSHGPLDAP